ncbi:MAG: glucose-6-phosphate isomerase [Gemmatales bacterium]|nr:glucose-6-phosphate isomerase [Gemmatales bacterium]
MTSPDDNVSAAVAFPTPDAEPLRFDFRNAVYEHWRLRFPQTQGQPREEHFLKSRQLAELFPTLAQLREQVRREIAFPEERARAPQPVDHGFITLPQQLLEEDAQAANSSLLQRIRTAALQIRELADRVVILGIGGSYLGARALAEAVLTTHHNELSAEVRRGIPRYYFEGNGLDNDALADLIHLLQPPAGRTDSREMRTALVVVSKSGTTLETAAAFRVLWRYWCDWYSKPLATQLLTVVTECPPPSRLYQVAQTLGLPRTAIFPIPNDVGGRFSVFSPAGLLPAAILGLDIGQLLRGAHDMTEHCFRDPVEQNLPLLFAAVSYLYYEKLGKPIRVLSVWSKKLEALGLWYDQLVSESLGKEEKGPTPITAVQTRDLHSRGQQHQDGTRDRIIHNVFVNNIRKPPIRLGIMPDNADQLNDLCEKSIHDLLRAAWQATNQAYGEDARATTDLILPVLDEYTLGQLLQMLMLATVIEGRLMGVNPYGQPGVEAYKRNMRHILGLSNGRY